MLVSFASQAKASDRQETLCELGPIGFSPSNLQSISRKGAEHAKEAADQRPLILTAGSKISKARKRGSGSMRKQAHDLVFLNYGTVDGTG
jgi:hypothetical protein